MPDFLPDPEVEYVREDGRIVSAIMRVQRKRATHTVRPNPDVPVFFAVDAEGYPVAFIFHAPIEGVAAMEVVEHLYEDGHGPRGVGQRVKLHFLTRDQIRAAVHALKGMLETASREQLASGA